VRRPSCCWTARAGVSAASACVRVPGNIVLLDLPPYSPELNPMENVWAFLRSYAETWVTA
jgi:transposase